MSNLSPAEVVIEMFGVRPLAKSLGIAPSSILRWREREGRIPGKYHVELIEMSKGRLSADDVVFGR
jgi:hypothetical protein